MQIKKATCKNCGFAVVSTFTNSKADDVWRHDSPNGIGAVGCRAASFDRLGDWDDSLDRAWKARPVKDSVSTEQIMNPDVLNAWVISQAIRNALEAFHGGGAVDPDHPDSGEGFISDTQMRALNIVVRYTVYEAVANLLSSGEDQARYVRFQLNTLHDYMEAPGSPELEKAYREVTGDC